MVKKIAIEENDLRKIEQWDDIRADKVADTLEELNKSDSTYVVAFDIADKDSFDNSVMMKFRFINGNYIYEGCEII